MDQEKKDFEMAKICSTIAGFSILGSTFFGTKLNDGGGLLFIAYMFLNFVTLFYTSHFAMKAYDKDFKYIIHKNELLGSVWFAIFFGLLIFILNEFNIF